MSGAFYQQDNLNEMHRPFYPLVLHNGCKRLYLHFHFQYSHNQFVRLHQGRQTPSIVQLQEPLQLHVNWVPNVAAQPPAMNAYSIGEFCG